MNSGEYCMAEGCVGDHEVGRCYGKTGLPQPRTLAEAYPGAVILPRLDGGEVDPEDMTPASLRAAADALTTIDAMVEALPFPMIGFDLGYLSAVLRDHADEIETAETEAHS